MAKAVAEIRSLARNHTEAALSTLASIMHEPKSPAAARVTAAQVLLDRGWGKAAQVMEDGDGNPMQLVVMWQPKQS